LLAYLSWRFVETPFRERNRFSRNEVALYAVLGSLAFVVFGVLGSRSNGFDERFTSDERVILSYTTYAFRDLYRVETCLLEPGQAYSEFSRQCVPNRVAAGALIWGDSHAAAISYGLRRTLQDVAQYTASGCPPLVDVEISDRPHCKKINDFVMEEIQQIRPGMIILHANWRRYKNYDVAKQLERTIDFVRRVSPFTRITIVGVMPQWNPSLPVYMVKRHILLAAEQYVDNSYVRNGRILDKDLRAVAEKKGVAFFSAIDALCVSDRCRATTAISGGLTLTMWDSGHLTEGGSIFVATELARGL